eukprot:CAMPEP_0119491258 /NCGR_PEP_ID=MMETSP1344-20130328/16189_1 /TAXON_ID=236787 /ORGANISM="Florenciella parvula, Strain CCMP2471" /LENGTH=30 /DNA_ID= /DNA_START= /DNA_END= /DNA_ORIENTATION=
MVPPEMVPCDMVSAETKLMLSSNPPPPPPP